MFKKEPQVKHSANIKSSERRRLLGAICKEYRLPQEEITKECELNLLPAITKQASFKSPLGFTGIIYFNEQEVPLWFKTRDSQIYPTLYTLWKCAFLLPTVRTHAPVIKVLTNGADLMLPGTIPPFDSRCTKGAIVGVVDYKHPTVIQAIGRCNLNLTQFDNVVGRSGVAVEIIHCKLDSLFTLNDLVDISEPEEVDTNIPLKEVVTGPSIDDADKETVVPSTIESSDDEGINPHTDEQSPKVFESKDVENVAEELSDLSVEDVDNFFVRALLQTLKLETFELPISSSQFMSLYIFKNFPMMNPNYCNIKKTSWKKTAKFLKAMDKLGYISVKGKADDLTIVGLMKKNDPVIQGFNTHRTMSSRPTSSTSKPPTEPKGANDLSIIYLYRPTKKSRMFFNIVDANFTNYYQANELRALLDTYIKKQGLVNVKMPRNITVDENLHSITNLNIGTVSRDKIFLPFLSSFSQYYKIVPPNCSLEDAELAKGAPRPITIISEVKIGRKVVTRVQNVEQYHIKPTLFANELKVKCSGSTTVGPCVQDPKVIEVAVQGPHGKLIIELLRNKGVPTNYIKFEDKTKKKKRS
ncbi:uncharacterized protein PRCAT00002425001 [Priceomyces carsonii]|uniref:uncharacterized protein n=1 Tax=Priceomyces carsonii TaxID=28549 RepID=UPI002EDA6E1D|nr:unnamed protein product [Priceomyces carsonii]